MAVRRDSRFAIDADGADSEDEPSAPDVVVWSADATPLPRKTAAPIPRATANPPTRPTHAPAVMTICIPVPGAPASDFDKSDRTASRASILARTSDLRADVRQSLSTSDRWSRGRCRSGHGGLPSLEQVPPWPSVAEGFGVGPVLRHTVRVALSQVRLVGHTTSALAGASGPSLDRVGLFGAGECAQGRHTRARGSVDHRQVNSGGIASAPPGGSPPGGAHEDQAQSWAR